MLNFTFPNTSQVGQFLYGQLGLESGSNAVITNGRVSFIWAASDELKYSLIVLICIGKYTICY